MTKDKYNQVINSVDTYEEIADKLNLYGAVIIGWTDEQCTHLDIMFAYKPYMEGSLQGGMNDAELFVAVRGGGMFGFDVGDTRIFPEYAREKLGVWGEGLDDLLNGVIKELTLYKNFI